MSHVTRGAAIALIAAATSGCAGMTFHDDKGTETGIRFYTPKPYVLVGNTAPDKPVEVKIVHLADLEHPMYARYKPGIGFFKFALSVGENGALTSFNQEADAKLPELVSNLSTLMKTLDFGREGGSTPSFELYEVVMKDGVAKLKRVK